jgi:hypothetical protein
MYDRVADPYDTRNLAHPGAVVPDAIKEQRQRLHRKLTQVMEDLGTTPDGIVWPKVSGGDAWVATELPERKVDPGDFTQ